MLVALIVVSGIAFVCFAMWMWAETDLADALADLEETERDLQVALGWEIPAQRRRAVVLHAIEGGEA